MARGTGLKRVVGAVEVAGALAATLALAAVFALPFTALAAPDSRAPEGFVVPIREVRVSGGAEFVVAVCGDIMTMPGLPRTPSAEAITVNEAGQIEGLF